MVELTTHPREPIGTDGSWQRTVEVDGVIFRVTMMRHVIPPKREWRKPTVRWTATITTFPDNGTRYVGTSHPSIPLRRLFRIAGLIITAECGCEVAIWHYNEAAQMCDTCADREQAQRAEADAEREAHAMADLPEPATAPAWR